MVWSSSPILISVASKDVIVVCAAVISISSAFAVIPVPPTTFNVTVPDVPPSVNPVPAITPSISPDPPPPAAAPELR